MLKKLVRVKKKLKKNGKELDIFFITVDPERDTVEVMNNYLTGDHDYVTGITGDREEIEALARSWGIQLRTVSSENDDEVIKHTASALLLDGHGRLVNLVDYREDFRGTERKINHLYRTAWSKHSSYE
jgi:protein SCO1/2